MKEFKKTNENLFICEECEKIFTKYSSSLTRHIIKYHNEKEYFDKWIKENDENICKICGNENVFIRLQQGYRTGCCKKHMNKISYQIRKISLLKNFGVENTFQREDIKEKCKQTCLKNYGVENISQSEEAKKKKENTCLKNYGVKSGLCLIEKVKKSNLKNNGVEYPMQSKKIQEKSKITCLKKYSVENPSQAAEIKKRKEDTCLKHFGVKYANQNQEILEKSQKTALTLKQFKNTNLYYQGSYELNFLERYYDKYPDIQRGSSIKYKFNRKNKVYHPDFYIPSLNLIIECKNSWLVKRDIKIIKAKKKATISNGFNYVMIVDKNYNNLNF